MKKLTCRKQNFKDRLQNYKVNKETGPQQADTATNYMILY